MIDTTQLTNIDYVISNLSEIYQLHKQLALAIELAKDKVRMEGDYEDDNVKIVKGHKIKYVPLDIKRVIARYPIELYDIYNISLNKDAKNIITDDTLVRQSNEEFISIKLKETTS